MIPVLKVMIKILVNHNTIHLKIILRVRLKIEIYFCPVLDLKIDKIRKAKGKNKSKEMEMEIIKIYLQLENSKA